MSEQEFNRVFANNLKNKLSETGMTRAEFAEKMGVGISSVGFWTSGAKTPRMDKIDKMCSLFHCKRSDLLEERSPKSPDDIFIEKFQRLEPHEQDVVMQLVDTLLENARKKERRVSAS